MDSLNFIASKVIWLIISPNSLLLFLALSGLLFLFLNKIRLAKILLGISISSFAFFAIFPAHDWLAFPLEDRFINNPDLPNNIDGIIVLGGSIDLINSYIWDQVETNGKGERNIAFLVLAKRFPDARLIFTGGSGVLGHQDQKEADIARHFFSELGIPAERVIYERNSRNTYENAVNSKALMQPMPGENWILITSAMHMPRSVGLFCQQGWPVIPFPVDHGTSPGHLLRVEFKPTSNLGSFSSVTREWVGLLAHRLSGKTAALFPASC